ncbi:CPBP family intramembrane glutamic endopeptidase [Streptomyces abyssomicinicus]|uniref:CPBP family intramembrane glutamic endopeptidase n=1 Tax=Streptomyces abyssomicinicus TaxID=574929 RepID=UPI0012505B0E|nr:CPBP family intramembrane glutamic endopeptidase [Streptomyces abyssomicinicus]
MDTTSAAQQEGSGRDEDRDERGGRLRRIARSPLGWMLTGTVGVGLVAGLTATGQGPVPVLGAAAAWAVYWLVMRRVARRSTPEMAWRGAGREALLGGGIGLGFVLVSTLLITAFGGYSFSWAGNGVMSVGWAAVTVQIGVAVTEELMFRGLALQALELMWGSRVALVITSLFFGVAHMGAPGASAWSGLAIALEAGLLLGAAFLWRRSIWFVVGLHFAWNTTEQLLGIPVSGHTPEGLFTVDVHGSDLLTGGGFGMETSIVAALIGVTLAVTMLVLARRNGGVKSRRRAGQ